MKKISFIIAALLLLVSAACKKSKSDLNAVEEKLVAEAKAGNSDCTCDPYINRYNWKGAVIYGASCRGPLCNCTVILYNDKGEVIPQHSESNFVEILKESEFVKTIYSCKE